MIQAKRRALLRIGDIAAILLVVLLAGALLWAFLAAKKGKTVEISVEGEVVAVLPLQTDVTYPIISRGYHLTVCVAEGEVFVADADCPDLVCKNTGKISAKGTSIVCAAAGVSVRVMGGGDDGADFVAG